MLGGRSPPTKSVSHRKYNHPARFGGLSPGWTTLVGLMRRSRLPSWQAPDCQGVVMAGNDQVSSSDIAGTLAGLGETTTAAELVRKQGQSKKLKVISEKKLMEWILSLLNQHMAGKADAFSDAEKEE